MKEVLGSLPEVITAYKNYNLLVPTATDVQLNPFYKFHVEEVPVDLGENSGDIFKVGSVKTGKQDEKGKDIWEDVFSLSKPLLNKMAMAAGIQFNPKETYGERIDRVTYRAQAQGAMRKADGTARTETDQKVICLEDEEEKYRIEFADKAAKGITDEKQAQAAAEIFSGQWVESKNKWGKKCQAFVVAKEDRDRYIDRSVMVNMALLKKTWAEKAMTGAKLRVIRALLGVKGTYTKAELQKNFAIPTVIFSPDFSDPQVRQAMLTQGMNSVNNMFGTPQIAVKSVDFESESTVFTQDDLNNPAYAYVKAEKQKLQVFQRGSVYLATKKIGKHNPKALEIEADNRKRQEWNRAVDMALISGIPEPQIMEVKQKRISEPIKSAISRKGSKPNLFAKVVTMAIEALELMIETVLVKKYKESLEQKEQLQKTDASDMETVIPETERKEVKNKEPEESRSEPKQPEMTRLASKYPKLYKIYNELEQQNNTIYKKEKQRSDKKKELSEIKGWFKGRKKKELQEEIDDLTSQIRNMKDYLPKSVQKVGYRSVQEFLKDFKTAKSEYSQYQKAIAQWKQETGKEPEPQLHGVRAKLAANRKKIEQEQKNTQRARSQSKDRGAR